MGLITNMVLGGRYSSPHTKEGLTLIKQKYDNEITEAREKKRIAVFTLCPTYSCNMACTYCFQKNYNKNLSLISDAVLSKVFLHLSSEIESIRSENPKIPITLELFGGEPLQIKNINVVEKCLEFARQLSCKVWVVSNGYELYDFVKLFAKFRDVLSQVSVTLDGTGEYHNSRRKVKDVDGSFDKITKGVDLFLRLGFKVNVCTNIDSDNINKVEQLIEFVRMKGWGDYGGFNLHVGRVYDRLMKIGYQNVINETRILRRLLQLVGTNKPKWLSIGFLKTTERLATMIGASLDQNEYGKAGIVKFG